MSHELQLDFCSERIPGFATDLTLAGHVAFPFGCALEVVLAGSGLDGGAPLMVHELHVAGSIRRQAQACIVAHVDPDAGTFELGARGAATAYLRGSLRVAALAEGVGRVPRFVEGQPLDAASFYQILARAGARVGPALRGVASAMRADLCLEARLQQAPAWSDQASAFVVHPVWLQAAHDAALVLASGADAPGLPVLRFVRDVRVHSPGVVIRRVVARRAVGPEGDIDVWLLDGADQVAASLLGLRFDVEAVRSPQASVRDLIRGCMAAEYDSLDDNLLHSGATSLDLLRMVAALREHHGVEVSESDFFAEPTGAYLLRQLREPGEVAVRSGPHEASGSHPGMRLSPHQQDLWAAQQQGTAGPAYNEACALHLRGPLDEARLAWALRALIAEQPGLRLTVAPSGPRFAPPPALHAPDSGDDALQVVRPGASDPFELSVELECHAREPFDLQRGPVLRAVLFVLNDAQRVLLLCCHHIAVDGFSLRNVILPRLQSLYAGGSPLDAAAGLAAYAAACDAALALASEAESDGRLERAVAPLREVPHQLRLGHRVPDHDGPAWSGARQPVSIDEPTASAVEALARSQQVTPFAVLLAAYQCLLSRHSGRSSFLVGVPMDVREASGLSQLVGYFVSLVPVLAQLDSSDTFVQHVHKVALALREALLGRQLSLGQRVRALRPERTGSGHPLLQFVFGMQYEPVSLSSFGDCSAVVSEVANGASKFDLSLVLTRSHEGLSGEAEYRRAVVGEATVQALLERFCVLLRDAVRRPHTPLDELCVLRPADEGTLRQLRGPVRPLPSRCAWEQVFEHAALTPARVAVCDGAQQMSFGELQERVMSLAGRLSEAGVRPGSRVAVVLAASADLVTAWLAIHVLGASLVSIDPATPPARLDAMLKSACARVLVAPPRPAGVTESVPLVTVGGAGSASGGWSPVRPRPTDEAYVIFTSGTSGRPKGVRVAHGGLLNLCQWHRRTFEVGPDDRASLYANPGFDAFVWEVFGNLCAGASLHVVPREVRLDMERLAGWIDAERISLAFLPTEVAHRFQPLDGTRLRHLLVGGGQLLRASAGETPVVNAYGPTECTVVATAHAVRRSEDCPAIGCPIDNTEAFVLDPAGHAVPPGVAGELWLTGAGLALGYLEDADAGFALLPVPALRRPPAAYATGDLVRQGEDGSLHFIGRIDGQISIRGHRVEPAEVEAVLRQHRAVSACVVVGQALGAVQRLVAFVVPHAAPAPADAHGALRRELTELCESRLPYYMRPAQVRVLSHLPMNERGKVDRARLLASPTETVSAPEQGARTDPPSLPVLLELFRQTLGYAEIDPQSGFYEQGGDSLRAVELVNQAAARGLALDRAWLESDESPLALANRLEAREPHCPALDLSVAAVLPASVLSAARHGSSDATREVLLVGATGLLGSSILKELLGSGVPRVRCLVRAPNARTALERLRGAARRHTGWGAAQDGRVEVVVGDLCQPALGLDESSFQRLARTTRAVYLVAAPGDRRLPYEALHHAVVGGTSELLRLAWSGGAAHVHRISSFEVLAAASGSARDEAAELGAWRSLGPGLCQAHWVAEQRCVQAAAAGLGVSTYRLGPLLWDAAGLMCAQSPTGRMLRDIVEHRIAPGGLRIAHASDMGQVARAIVLLAQGQHGGVHHLAAPGSFAVQSLVEWLRELGVEIPVLEPAEWLARMRALGPASALYPLHAPLLSGELSLAATGGVDMERTLGRLAALGFSWAPADCEGFVAMLQRMGRAGELGRVRPGRARG